MRYTAGTIAKSLMAGCVAFIGAAVAAAGGPDLSHLDLVGWLSCFGVGLTAGTATFATPNKPSTSVADQVINGIPVVAAAAAQAQNELDRVRQTANDALGGIPMFGKQAQDILNGLPRF